MSFQQFELYSVPAKRSKLQDIELAVVSQQVCLEAILEPGRLGALHIRCPQWVKKGHRAS